MNEFTKINIKAENNCENYLNFFSRFILGYLLDFEKIEN
jgi:hypothetical protein